MLTDNTYKHIYRTLEDRIDRDFLYPCYSESILLERASGYFKLDALMLSFEGLLKFLDNGGIIHLICSPELSEDDIAIIKLGHSIDSSHVTKAILRELKVERNYSAEDINKLDVICNMIATGRLVIKIAFKPSQGIYHEKFGVFADAGRRCLSDVCGCG